MEVVSPPVSKELKKRWSYFIRKVYETDPLTCPKCQGEMRIISFIDLSACGHAQADRILSRLLREERVGVRFRTGASALNCVPVRRRWRWLGSLRRP